MPIAHFDVTPTSHVLDTHPKSCSPHATFDTGIAKKDQKKKKFQRPLDGQLVYQLTVAKGK